MVHDWHAISVDEALTALESSNEGLREEEAEKRLALHGPNEFGQQAEISWLRTLIAQVKSPLVSVLAIAAGVSLAAGHPTDAAIILAIVLLNTVIGFVQEYRAERAMAELAKFAAPTARIKRDSEERDIVSKQLVPGDVVMLAAGDRVPADGRILEAHSLESNESALTGESAPVEKNAKSVEVETPLAARSNMVYSGTVVTRGRGIAVVAETGGATEFGKIAAEVRATDREDTPLQRQLAVVGKMLGIIALGLAGLVFVIGILRGIDMLEMFMFAVASAVAAIPEGLPAVVTVALAIGLKNMARRNAIIRRLPAVESLGSATVIVTDKTGTLTQNRMTVESVWYPGATEEMVGQSLLESEQVKKSLAGAALASDSELKEADGKFEATGDPTEAAFVIAAARAGLRKPELEAKCKRVGEIPFDAETGYMATLHRCEEGMVVYLKGMPQVVLKRCKAALVGTEEVSMDDVMQRELDDTNTVMAGRALRVLAVAYKNMADDKSELAVEDIEQGFVHLGLVGMIDPPRPEAIEAVERCRRAGIRVIMATGDSVNTARAIASEFGLIQEDSLAIDGAELSRMTDEELKEKLPRIALFARMEPAQKLRLVNILQQMGEVVAMTGDGVNDAPALKTADIGVAMGITGTGVAKEAGDMVLADDNFATIVAAVEEGRIVFSRIRKVVSYLVSTNAGEIVTVAFAVAVGWPLPLTAVQLLWVNLVTDSAPSLALAVDPPSTDVLSQPPRDPRENVINRETVLRLAIVAPAMAAATLIAFFLGLEDSLAKAQTMAFLTLSVSQLYNAVNVRSAQKSVFAISPFANKALLYAIVFALALQALPVYVPAFRAAFDTVPLTASDWAVAIGLGSVVLWAEEIRKLVLRGRQVS
ncbi:MAG: cation-translocating P-type ATPase [Armatimonadota bacterium]